MSEENLDFLREEVERVFGRKILNASDCQHLSNDIYQQIKIRVSLNTLRRFFHLMKSKYQPSSFTLNLLSKYCSFASYEAFTRHKERVGNNHTEPDSDLLNFLILLFKDLDAKGVEDLTYISLIHEIINNIEKWPHLIDKFQSQIAKTANGQFFYYEQFANIDKLNSFYGDGLRYYLHEKKDIQAQIFGCSLLCFRSWLSMNKQEVYTRCLDLSKYTLDEKISHDGAARYFAARLYNADINGLDMEPTLVSIRDFYLDTKYSGNKTDGFPHFEFIISEALTLTKQYEEALFYIREAIRKKNNYMAPSVDLKLFESISLFYAIALRGVGKPEKSKQILDKISVKNFYFLSKKLNMILYLLQKKHAGKKDVSSGQLAYLIKQTGFKKLVIELPEVLEMAEQKQL